jgi:hypothetical protein
VNALVVLLFACVYLAMALGRWPGRCRTGPASALVGAIVLVLAGALGADEVRAATDARPW